MTVKAPFRFQFERDIYTVESLGEKKIVRLPDERVVRITGRAPLALFGDLIQEGVESSEDLPTAWLTMQKKDRL